ncbi:adenylate/guanylate cyclase domain-containing protein [Gordonia amicalis]|uniref:adenylate/guanylate cyclase domain-containing protein n=1 Tax=Gordonia amicalis TaxID=89053 RepID=UPI00295444CF|nr:adenylate/guanylate cyclase domain-containing protein [Gordonia amicalis]MDV7174347.1 adenylate/guanylate cyclase domain-containing protein [Gordonia amicalis]
MTCRSCGTALRPHAKFCDECGASTDSADVTEYKQVTVLFADVVRSMDLAAAMDAERWQQIITSLAERSAAVARRRGDFTGDGVMAIFGAPKALEDHAFRGCQAALEIQESARRLAEDVRVHDGVDLALRVGVNSGEVIAGAVGSASLGYSAIGRQVGMAQRMESVAPPGGVMLSIATAQLVQYVASLGEPEWVQVKGADRPVQARRLLALTPRIARQISAESNFVGRRREMAVVESMMDKTVRGQGCVMLLAGPPGLGKSRIARESAARAAARGFKVTWAFGDAHRRDVSFGVVAGLLRSALGLDDLDLDSARAQVLARFPNACAQDLSLLEDLLGIADPGVPLPAIEPDAKRRRLTALINEESLARTEPSLTIIEDAQWIDEPSEWTLVELLEVVPRAPSLVLITARPEYDGALKRSTAARIVELNTLGDADIEQIIIALTGTDPSVTQLVAKVVERAAGNPFYAEEMVRELVQRGVLSGERGAHVTSADVADVAVPATVQATIEARIDLLSGRAKRAVTAMSVIGLRMEEQLLPALGLNSAVDELLDAEIIERVGAGSSVEYVFRHPLIWAVAYRSMLRSQRAWWHRRVAEVIESTKPELAEQNAALIAEHLHAAGELHAAYSWHMRAATRSTNRDVRAARSSWQKAAEIAEALPDDDPERLSMRIAPTTMLCATDWQDYGVRCSAVRFAELSRLCEQAGDAVSLAIGRSGLTADLIFAGRTSEGARLSSEQIAVLESIGDPSLTMALAPPLFVNWLEAGDVDQVSRCAQMVIDLAGGDPTKGAGFGLASPLATAIAFRGVVRWMEGRQGWRTDIEEAIALARINSPQYFALVLNCTLGLAIQFGVLRADDRAVHLGEEALETSERVGDDNALMFAEYVLGIILLNRDSAADRRRGLNVMDQAREVWLRRGSVYLVPIAALMTARERATLGPGERDHAITTMRVAVDELWDAGRVGPAILGTGFLVSALLDRGSTTDMSEAERMLDRMRRYPNADAWVPTQAVSQQSRPLLARVRGDPTYPDFVSQYRAFAESVGYEGHMDFAARLADADN